MAKAKAKAKSAASKPRKPGRAAPANETNLMWALLGLLFISLLAAGFTAWTCDYVLLSFQDSNTMALLITDAGLKSDDAKLESNLTAATKTLGYLKDIGLAVVVGGVGIALSLVVRHYTKRS